MNIEVNENGIVLDVATAAALAAAIVSLADDASKLRPGSVAARNTIKNHAKEIEQWAWLPELIDTAHGPLYRLAVGLTLYVTGIEDLGIHPVRVDAFARAIEALAPGVARDFLTCALTSVRMLQAEQDRARAQRNAGGKA